MVHHPLDVSDLAAERVRTDSSLYLEPGMKRERPTRKLVWPGARALLSLYSQHHHSNWPFDISEL